MRIRMIFRAIAALGKSLGLSISAEGVENTAQQVFVTTTRCDVMQGNGLCRPLTAVAFEALLMSDDDSFTHRHPAP